MPAQRPPNQHPNPANDWDYPASRNRRYLAHLAHKRRKARKG